MVHNNKSADERMRLLHELAVQQMTTLSHLDLHNLPQISIEE